MTSGERGIERSNKKSNWDGGQGDGGQGVGEGGTEGLKEES